MINVSKLKGLMAEKGKTGIDMARVIGKTPKTFYSKMKAGVFGSDEIDAMVKDLEIQDPMSVFLPKE